MTLTLGHGGLPGSSVRNAVRDERWIIFVGEAFQGRAAADRLTVVSHLRSRAHCAARNWLRFGLGLGSGVGVGLASD